MLHGQLADQDAEEASDGAASSLRLAVMAVRSAMMVPLVFVELEV